MRARKQKGSALLVSLMIMVGLSLLGLGFVAISETESAISVNERNYVQAQSAAETGTKAVIQMFQNAGWAQSQGILPPNNQSFKTLRCHGVPTVSTTVCSDGKDYYKGTAGDLLFNAPFKGNNENRFYGDIDSPDVLIKDDGGAGTTYLDTLSSSLFYTPTGANEKLRISEIRVYAPPWPGAAKMFGSLTPTPSTQPTNGFFASSNSRYGVATIRVTAQKIAGKQVRAERSVKAVIAETPFPTVDGAIETSGSLVGQGNFHVYWGKLLSEKSTNVAREAVGLPWLDAKNVAWWEYGYDTTSQVTRGTTYQPGSLVNAPDTCIQGDPNLGKFAFRWNGGSPQATALAASAPTCAQWQAAESLGGTVIDGLVTWTAEESRPTRVDTTITDPTVQFYQNTNWFVQLLGRTFDDPWLHARARNGLTYGNNKTIPCGSTTLPHPCDYNSVTIDPSSAGQRYSNFFQNQYSSDSGPYPERLEAVFPTMDYEFWKAIAQSSSGQPNTSIYYFSYDPATDKFVGPNGQEKTVVQWLNAAPNTANGNKPYNGLGAGFYFFDTKNGKNPQFNKGGILTPEILLSSSTITDPKFQIRGYVYLNAEYFGSKGVGNAGIDDVYAMPPEPYRDIGYRQVCDDPAGCAVTGGTIAYKHFMLEGGTTSPPTLPSASYVTIGANNGQWSYQDVNHNNQFDVFVTDITKGGTVTITRPDGVTTLPSPTYVPVPWFDGCTPPDPTASPAVTGNCSEPHEPYLNLTYPTLNSPDGQVKVEWYDPNGASAASYRRPKTRTGPNTAVTCTATSSNEDCTSNAYDSTGVEVKGALVSLAGNHAAIAWGAIYNEGGYDATGNADYYGALLMRGDFLSNGTPYVWFDACLAVGCLETQLKMQRVMVTSMNTE